MAPVRNMQLHDWCPAAAPLCLPASQTGAVLRMAGQLGYLVLSSVTMNENLFQVMLANVHNLLVSFEGRKGGMGREGLMRRGVRACCMAWAGSSCSSLPDVPHSCSDVDRSAGEGNAGVRAKVDRAMQGACRGRNGW
jgi:hypothetical protein